MDYQQANCFVEKIPLVVIASEAKQSQLLGHKIVTAPCFLARRPASRRETRGQAKARRGPRNDNSNGFYKAQANFRLFFYIAAAILILAGCAPQVQGPMRICLPKQTVAQSIAELANNAQNLRPIRASGTCLFRYSVDGKKHKENFPVKLWFSPPSCIYLQGDAAFDPKAICLGSNETEFWFSIKPEASTYWWGRYDRVKHCFGNFLLAPGNLLEALGAVAIDSTADLTLSKHGEFDILTKTNSDNAVIKKIYVDSRDYLPRKIEYFSEDGQLAIVTELNNYKRLGEDFYLPALIKITGATTDSSKDSIRITLKSLKRAEFSQRIFQRRPPKGFQYIKELNADCRWTE